jgi:hypothetical protein
MPQPVPTDADPIRCSACGTQYDLPIAACAFCGQSLSRREPADVRSRAIQVILALAFIAMVIMLAFLG